MAALSRLNLLKVTLTQWSMMIDLWPWKLVWKTKLPPKVCCFSWLALKDACLTQDNLTRRNFPLANRCYMCQVNSECVNHLLLHCSVATDIWNMFLSIFGLHWTMPFNAREAYVSWSSREVDRTIKNVWNMVPASIFWCIWVERNSRCFDGLSTSIGCLKARCLVNLFHWANLTTVNNSDVFLDLSAL